MKGYELLAVLHSELEAELIRQKLAESGIESFMQHSDLVGYSIGLDSMKGIKIFVEPYDLEKATQLITDSKDNLTDDMEVDTPNE